jgi:hypothetical protein
MRKIIASLVFPLLIQGCGGSSSDTANTITPALPPTPVRDSGIIAFDNELKTAQATELFLYFPDDSITNINWQQTSGENVVFHATNSKAIAFTPGTSGSYTFQVNFKRNGTNEVLNHTIEVASDENKIAAMLGHAVLEGGDVSLRVFFNDSNLASQQSTIKWRQLSGPNVSFSAETDGEYAVFFTAPNITQDTLIEFNVSVTDGSNSYEDVVAVLIEAADDISGSDNTAYKSRLAKVEPFNANSPYADVLADCVYSNAIDYRTTCRLNELPLIAHDTTSPTVDDIMDRVVVSHPWMGQRFKEFLENSDPYDDFKNLLRATTAIVISYDIRPSYYWAVTGAIHLDANYFWLTPDERDTINQAPDFRATFGDALDFEMPWRYVKDNNYTSYFYPQDMRITRTAEDGVYNIAALLYHELAHANDFFPQTSWQNLNRSDRILDAVDEIFQSVGTQSDLLATTLPLNGSEMYSLAQVRFQGETASSTEQNYSPADVSQFFSTEDAPQFYNYSSLREDYAMLFDGFMMAARYNIFRDVAVTSQPQDTGDEYIVTWGQRGRIGEENIKPRVTFVTGRILPEFVNAAAVINNLPPPIAMEAGKTWAENLNISPDAATSNSVSSVHNSVSEKTRVKIEQQVPVDGQLFFEKKLPFKKRQ